MKLAYCNYTYVYVFAPRVRVQNEKYPNPSKQKAKGDVTLTNPIFPSKYSFHRTRHALTHIHSGERKQEQVNQVSRGLIPPQATRQLHIPIIGLYSSIIYTPFICFF